MPWTKLARNLSRNEHASRNGCYVKSAFVKIAHPITARLRAFSAHTGAVNEHRREPACPLQTAAPGVPTEHVACRHHHRARAALPSGGAPSSRGDVAAWPCPPVQAGRRGGMCDSRWNDASLEGFLPSPLCRYHFARTFRSDRICRCRMENFSKFKNLFGGDAMTVLCTMCHSPYRTRVLHATSNRACEQCGNDPSPGNPICMSYVFDPRTVSRIGEDTSVYVNECAEVDPVAWRNLKPLPKGATRHPAIPLACLELPDAASFMKGNPIPQKNFDPFGVSGST